MGVIKMDLSNKKYLLAVGCSHMAGSEIEGAGYTDRSKTNLSKAWPGQVARKLNLNYINLSQPGGSNEYIVRTTVEFVSNWVAQGRDPSELLVVLGWTTQERLEFTWEGRHIHWANGANPKAFMSNNDLNWDFSNWYKALQLYHTDYDFGMYRKLIGIITINSFLKMLDIEHIQVSNCARMIGHEFKHFSWEGLEQAFPKEVFYEMNNSFVQKFEDTHREHFTDWFHADETLHTMYAKEIVNYLESNNE
jgi:hypothetical protein